MATLIKDKFTKWEQSCLSRFNTLKLNEEELNRLFIDIYGLHDEITANVTDKDITIRKANLIREIKSLISYSIGCMFGRYSLDVKGIVYANDNLGVNKYKTFIPCHNNIIPITEEEYFSDDIVIKFIEFIKVVYGTETLEENLNFIAEALDNKGNSNIDKIRKYFLKEFYIDHVKLYQKRPIYWLFDSGKANSFKALIYVHRYNPNIMNIIRTNYLQKLIIMYQHEINNPNYTEKKIKQLNKKLIEIIEYEKKINSLALENIKLDFDDGVKLNYEKLQTDKNGKKYDVLGRIMPHS